MKPILKSAIALLCACLLLLGFSAALRGVSQKNAERERINMLCALLPGTLEVTEEAYAGEDTNITAIFRGNGGYVVEAAVAGYAAPITMWVGVTDDGKVTGLTMRELHETFGLGKNAAFDEGFLMQFLGKTSAVSVGEDIDALTGATVTSKAIARGVNSAIAYATGADVGTTPTKWGEW